MIEGIGTVANLNQEDPHTVQGKTEGTHETTADILEGKVNPVESLDNLSDKSHSNEETHSQDLLNRDSGQERIIDLLA